MTALRPLRPHQVTALDGLKWSIHAGKRSPLLQLPTGAGKTVIAAHIVAGARGKSRRVCFVVPAITLVDQTFERFRENGIDPVDMGVMQGDHPWRRPHAPIQIATSQTLGARELPITDVVVVDEAHRKSRIVEAWATGAAAAEGQVRRPLFVGLSATPWARGMAKIWDDLIKPTSMRELIEAGHLSPFRVFAPSHPDLAGVRTVAGDYHEGDLAERMSQGALVADVVTTWLAKGANQPTLCFAVNLAHAQMLAKQFAAAGVPTGYIDASTPREERDRIGRQLEAGAIKVVCNVGTLTTGVDWDVRCLILARPTKSEMLFVQIIGRALRTAPGKDFATILDHSDTHLRLGLVTDIDHDEMDDGRPKPKASPREEDERKLALPRECKSCQGLIPATMRVCPCCGVESIRHHGVDQVEGELGEFVPGQKRRGPGNWVRDEIAAMGKQVVYSQLLRFAEERGRSKGWAAHAYRKLFDVWPRQLLEEATETTPLVRSWIRSQDIAWAKSRPKAGGEHAGA